MKKIKEKKVKTKKIKKSKQHIKVTKKTLTIILISISVLLIILSIFIYIKYDKSRPSNKLYKDYQNDINYSCENKICTSNELKFENDDNYSYVETINLKDNIYNFDVKNSENNINYKGNYKVNEKLIEVSFKIDEIEFSGTYDINKQYISLIPLCENCSLDDYNNIYDNYRDNAYNTCMLIINYVMNIVNNDTNKYK